MTAIAGNRLDAAEANIHAGLAVSNVGSDIACRLTLAIAAVEVAVARHDPAAARAADSGLRELQHLSGALPAMLDRWCAVAHADTHLATGQPQAAIALLLAGGDNQQPAGFAAALEHVARCSHHHQLRPQRWAVLLDVDPTAQWLSANCASRCGPAAMGWAVGITGWWRDVRWVPVGWLRSSTNDYSDAASGGPAG